MGTESETRDAIETLCFSLGWLSTMGDTVLTQREFSTVLTSCVHVGVCRARRWHLTDTDLAVRFERVPGGTGLPFARRANYCNEEQP